MLMIFIKYHQHEPHRHHPISSSILDGIENGVLPRLFDERFVLIRYVAVGLRDPDKAFDELVGK